MRAQSSQPHPFVCPTCGPEVQLTYRQVAADGTGVYQCERDGEWFLQVGDIVDFSPPLARDYARWKDFWEQHGRDLDLAPPLDTYAGGPSSQRAFFDDYTATYEQIVATTSFWRAHDRLAIESWIERIAPDANLIDLGAGAGRSTLPLAKRMSGEATLVSTDLSYQMLKVSADKLAAAGGARGNVYFAIGDCQELTFLPPDYFDIGLAYGIFHHVDRPDALFEGASRVLRPTSHLLIHDNNASGMRRIFDLAMKLSPLWDSEHAHDDHPVINRANLHRWAGESGFEIRSQTSVFLPPHLYNKMSVDRAYKVLQRTDRMFGKNRLTGNQGGLILAEAYRGEAPLLPELAGAEPRRPSGR